MADRVITSWLSDMDGVLVHDDQALPGAVEFVHRLREKERPFLLLTNNSLFTPQQLRERLLPSGLDVPVEAIWTSALATATFLADQAPGGSAYAIGEDGLRIALEEAGIEHNDRNPDFVVLGENHTFLVEELTQAVRFILDGARFVATNPDVTGPGPQGAVIATGAVAAMITTATGRAPYFVGKPNPMMFRSALNRIDAHSENTAMIGDRMDTDIVAGIEAGLATFLVLTGSTTMDDLDRFSFRPSRIVPGIGDLVDLI
ncbi:MAG TPA: HAD-IIA family hydrolase [Actinomycetales bacterium]|nr:HAD-IIA family hydrolase [Actinomycetales bacterium]